MANDTGNNPLYFDTNGTVTNKQLQIVKIAWLNTESNAIVADNDLVITDSNGVVICNYRAAAPDAFGQYFNLDFPKSYRANGLSVTCDGGICLIFIE
jgi:hypothetical protein